MPTIKQVNQPCPLPVCPVPWCRKKMEIVSVVDSEEIAAGRMFPKEVGYRCRCTDAKTHKIAGPVRKTQKGAIKAFELLVIGGRSNAKGVKK